MESENLKLVARILEKNKKTYSSYIRFRKKIFYELAPKDSDVLLYLLPWLLSVNHQSCPGYLSDLKYTFRVFNVDNDDIRKREQIFKQMFGIINKASLLAPPSKYYLIQGIYTIGSVGTISQTSASDCDIWICYDKNSFDEMAWSQLNKKLNLIKGWLDRNIRMPVFFFLSDVNDIKNGRFGSVDSESSGSAQKNVLKEEFYRTTIVICGKIPLWWVSYDDSLLITYEQALEAINDEDQGQYDFIDFGNIEKIERSEYFGAALWQFHKSLSNPLKSIIKMASLKMLLDAPDESLICHQLRKQVLARENHDFFPDPSGFTMLSIFNYYDNHIKGLLKFLKECFFLRCDIKPNDLKQNLKNKLASILFKEYPIDLKNRTHLSNFNSWTVSQQMHLGNKLFKFLIYIYKGIFSSNSDMAGEIDIKDLTILGRIIGAKYQQKDYKIPVINKPTSSLNLSDLDLTLEGNIWHLFPGNNRSQPLMHYSDIIYIIAYIVWNNLFAANWIHMEPNSSSVTVQEIINLGIKIKDIMLTYDTSGVEHSNYLKKERITKMLVVISFEKSSWEKDINDFSVIYKNNWGELFVRRFKSRAKFEVFLRNSINENTNVDINYYLQRNCTYYDKIIDRTKKIILSSINKNLSIL